MIDDTIQKFINLHSTFEKSWDSCKSNSFRFASMRGDGQEVGFKDVKDWKWSGKPTYDCLMYRITNREIQLATIADCLTSPSEYIRECKKFLMEEERIRQEWQILMHARDALNML